MTVIVGPTLPEPYYSDVEDAWEAIAEEFGTNGISNPIPHFTLYGLELETDLDTLEAALRDTVAGTDPFPLRTDGLGVFPGDHVWIPVARSRALDRLHREVVDTATEHGSAPTPYYEPDRWFPHIGLALGFDSDTVGDIVGFLREREDDFGREFTVDNVEITYRPDDAEAFERVASIDF
jgi:2'-5' RNA ligase